ncbi:RHS repeat-associated core domain-containing protein [Streptomyces sp. NPDC051563]|uniref:RHS repeat-associated core domain-containing protein n=1 Tax=Streptomyces sp. NPDC051563 TaxID=3365659 RepID=UPI003787FBBB
MAVELILWGSAPTLADFPPGPTHGDPDQMSGRGRMCGVAELTEKSGTAATENPYRFVGGTYDRTTGYLKYGQRWYDPTTGRFTTQDPLTFLANPAQGNRYAYAGPNPVNNIGPTGKRFLEAVSSALDAKSLGEAAGAAENSEWGDLAGVAAGALAGAVTEATCGTAAAAISLPTAGVGGVLVGAGCLELGEFVGSQVEGAVSEKMA